MDVESLPLPLLSALVAQAHRVLRDLDREDVPPSLRRVADSERLPPPLARSLIRELDDDAWLRAKVAEAWNGRPAGGAVDEATDLFLNRPEGWESRLAGLASTTRLEDVAVETARLEHEVAALRSELEKARARAKAADKRALLAEQRADRADKAAKGAAAPKTRAKTSPKPSEADQAVQDELRRVQEALDDAGARNRALRAGLLRARRSTSETASPGWESGWSYRDPLTLAAHLDELALAAEAAPPAAAPARGTPAKGPPRRIAPDDPAMIDWLLAQSDPTTILVDGYNVSFQLDPASFHTGELRSRLNESLGRLRTRAVGPLRVVVVYDSGLESGDRAKGPRGVEVRFTDPDVLADEEILGMLGTSKGRVVVVSTDREVREGAEQRGALGLWSQALAGWLSR